MHRKPNIGIMLTKIINNTVIKDKSIHLFIIQ